MPKTKPLKLCKNGKQTFVLIDGKKHYLTGQWGSVEVETAYARFQLEWWEIYRNPLKISLPTLVS